MSQAHFLTPFPPAASPLPRLLPACPSCVDEKSTHPHPLLLSPSCIFYCGMTGISRPQRFCRPSCGLRARVVDPGTQKRRHKTLFPPKTRLWALLLIGTYSRTDWHRRCGEWKRSSVRRCSRCSARRANRATPCSGRGTNMLCHKHSNLLQQILKITL